MVIPAALAVAESVGASATRVPRGGARGLRGRDSRGHPPARARGPVPRVGGLGIARRRGGERPAARARSARAAPRRRHRRVPRADRADVARGRRPRDDEGHLRLGRADRHERGTARAARLHRARQRVHADRRRPGPGRALGGAGDLPQALPVLSLVAARASTRPCACGPTRRASSRSSCARSPPPTCSPGAAPTNTEEMQYSLVWPVATALARGRFGVDEVLGGFDDPLVAQIAERVRIEVDPELTRAFPARRLTELEVVSSDGSTLRSGVIEAAGEPRSAGFEDILAGKVLRFLDPEVALPLGRARAPAGDARVGALPRGARAPARVRAGRPGARSIDTRRRRMKSAAVAHPGGPARGDPVAGARAFAHARARPTSTPHFPRRTSPTSVGSACSPSPRPSRSGGTASGASSAFTPFYEVIEALAFVDTSTAQLLQVHSHALGFLSRHGTPPSTSASSRRSWRGDSCSRRSAARPRLPATSRGCTARSSSPTETAGG